MPPVRPLRGLGRGSLRNLLTAGTVMALLVGLAAPARAVDPIRGVPIPTEQLGDRLALPMTQGITFDIDGDGTKELVTIGSAAEAQGLSAVRVWWVDADGAATQSNEVPLRRAASVDELLSGRGALGIDRDEMIAVQTVEPGRLFTARIDGQAAAFVAAIGTHTEQPVPCCLTIWQILPSGDHAIDLKRVADTRTTGLQLIVADFEGDGTDELFVNEGPVDTGDSPNRVNGPTEASVLHWNGDRFTREALRITALAACCSVPMDAGETDGERGDEVILAGQDFEGTTEVVRLTYRDGKPVFESAAIRDAFAAQAVTLAQGPALITSDGFSLMHLWSWPRDRQPVQEAERLTGGMPLAMFGSGDRTRLMVGAAGAVSSVLVLPGDLGLGAGPSVVFGRDTRTGGFVADAETPPMFSGVLPDGLPGVPDAYLFSGQLVTPLTSSELLGASRPAPLLVGMQPLGRVGPYGEWEAIIDNRGGEIFVGPGGNYVDLQFASPSGTVSLVGMSDLMDGEENGGDLQPTFYGAAPDPEHAKTLIVSNRAVVATIQGPPGTTVTWRSRGVDGRETIGPAGLLQIELLEASGPDAPDDAGATPTIWAVTPGGHSYATTWRIRVFRQPPELTLAASDDVIQLSPTVSGRTDPGTTVTVNGVAADVSVTGAFTAPVTAGMLPTEFRVVATDPVGNESAQIVSIVSPVDYRRLPFVPIAVLLTVIAGAVFYLRKPDIRPQRRSPDDEATFEEIGG